MLLLSLFIREASSCPHLLDKTALHSCFPLRFSYIFPSLCLSYSSPILSLSVWFSLGLSAGLFSSVLSPPRYQSSSSIYTCTDADRLWHLSRHLHTCKSVPCVPRCVRSCLNEAVAGGQLSGKRSSMKTGRGGEAGRRRKRKDEEECSTDLTPLRETGKRQVRRRRRTRKKIFFLLG